MSKNRILPYPQDHDLVTVIVNALVAYGRTPAPGKLGVDDDCSGHYRSVHAQLSNDHKQLWLFPSYAATTDETLQYADDKTIINIAPLAQEMVTDQLYRQLCLVLRDAAVHTPISKSQHAIGFFMRVHRDHVIACGAALFRPANIKAVLIGFNNRTRTEMLLLHDDGISTVMCDDYVEFGAEDFFPWEQVVSLQVNKAQVVLSLSDASSPLKWSINMGQHHYAEDISIAQKMASSMPIASITQKAFVNEEQKTIEQKRIIQEAKNLSFDAEMLVQRYGIDFTIETLDQLDRDVYFGTYATQVMRVLLAKGDNDRALGVARMHTPDYLSHTFDVLVKVAIEEHRYAGALAMIEEVRQSLSETACTLFDQWYLWHVICLLELDRDDAAQQIATEGIEKHIDSESSATHLAYALAFSTEDNGGTAQYHLQQAFRYNPELTSMLGDRLGHCPVVQELQQYLRHTEKYINSIKLALEKSGYVYNDEIIMDDLPTPRMPEQSFHEYKLIWSQKILEDDYVTGMTAGDGKLVYNTNQNQLVVMRDDDRGVLHVHAISNEKYRADDMRIFANRLFVVVGVKGLFVLDLDDPQLSLLQHIVPQKGAGYKYIRIDNNRCFVFGNTFIEIHNFDEDKRLVYNSSIILPENVYDVAQWQDYLIVICDNSILSFKAQDPHEVIDCLQLSEEGVDCSSVHIFRNYAYITTNDGIWRVELKDDGQLQHDGFVRMNFALSRAKINMQAHEDGIYMADISTSRHYSVFNRNNGPFCLYAARRIPELETTNAFHDVTFFRSDIIGCTGDTLYRLRMDGTTSDRSFMLMHMLDLKQATENPDTPIISFCDKEDFSDLLCELEDINDLEEGCLDEEINNRAININTLSATKLIDLLCECVSKKAECYSFPHLEFYEDFDK